METINTAMLATNCHVGTPVMPSRSIIRSGELNGTRLNTTQIGLSGKNINSEMNQNGATAANVNSGAMPWASLTVEQIAAIASETKLAAHARLFRLHCC